MAGKINVPSEYGSHGLPPGTGGGGKSKGFVCPNQIGDHGMPPGGGGKGATEGIQIPMKYDGGLKIPKPGFPNRPAPKD
jgi:hypothetical protein